MADLTREPAVVPERREGRLRLVAAHLRRYDPALQPRGDGPNQPESPVGAVASRVLRSAIALGPALIGVSCVGWLLGASVFDYVPSVWNDQVAYWHRLLTFANVGFDGGFYSPDEVVPRIRTHPFTIIVGSAGYLLGWEWYSGILFNMVVLACGIGLYLASGRMTTRQSLLTGLLVLTFWPISLYLPTTSHESLHQALAFAMAPLFYRVLSTSGQVSKQSVLGLLALLSVASLLRMSWALLAVPLFVVIALRARGGEPLTGSAQRGNGETRLRQWMLPLFVACALSAVFIVLAFAYSSAMSPPGVHSIADSLRSLRSDWLDGARLLYQHTLGSLREWFAVIPVDIYAVQKLIVSGLLLVLTARAVVLLAHWRTRRPAPAGYSPAELFFHIFNLGTIVAGTLTVYIMAGAYRVIGAHLLLSLLLMIRFRRLALVAAVIVAYALATPSFAAEYRQWKPTFTFDLEQLRTLRASVARHVTYDARALSPWCNTILIPVPLYDYRVTLIPPGIGVSFILSWDPSHLPEALRLPVKSRYLLLDDATHQALEATGQFRADRLDRLEIGTLYMNRDAACGSPPRAERLLPSAPEPEGSLPLARALSPGAAMVDARRRRCCKS
jgi:hypothetical protein